LKIADVAHGIGYDCCIDDGKNPLFIVFGSLGVGRTVAPNFSELAAKTLQLQLQPTISHTFAHLESLKHSNHANPCDVLKSVQIRKEMRKRPEHSCQPIFDSRSWRTEAGHGMLETLPEV
jgi:hypothetical protein